MENARLRGIGLFFSKNSEEQVGAGIRTRVLRLQAEVHTIRLLLPNGFYIRY